MSSTTSWDRRIRILRRAGVAVCILLPTLALFCGCAATERANLGLARLFSKPTEDVSPQRQARAESAQGDFNQRRDFAEYQAAVAYQKQGDLPACRRALEALVQRNPDHRPARLKLAEVAAELDDPDAAVHQVDYVLEKNPSDAEAHHAMAVLMDSTGDEPAALEHYRKADELQPGNELYQTSYRAAQAAALRDGAARGTTDPRSLLTPPAPPFATGAVDGNDRGVRTASADEEADAGFVQVDDAGATSALLDAGRRAIAVGDAAAATEFFRQAMAADPHNPQIPSTCATAALRENRPEVAIAVLEEALRSFPQSVTLRQALSLAYYRRGDYSSSQVAAQQALSLDKSSALSYFLVGSALLRLGQTEDAEANLRQAASLDPRYAAVR